MQEVVTRYNLAAGIDLFSRCPRCNGRLMPAEKDAVASRLEPNTLKYFNRFWLCQTCGQVYWRGSHVERILDQLRDILPDRL